VIEAVERQPGRLAAVAQEAAKLPAFARRDMLVAWSYRATFISDVVALFLQALLFYFVNLLVDERRLPEFGGSPVTYMEYVTVGIALAAFIQIGLGRVSAALRQEQMIGTLESLLATPTSPATIQLGSVLYDLLYVPIRTGLFLVLIAVGFELDFNVAGIPPAALVILFFVPFVWGLGLVSAAATMTFRGGSAGVGFGLTIMTLGSGAFFPLSLLPGWVESLTSVNPMAIAIEGMREPLLGVVDWSETLYSIAVLVPFSAASLAIGVFAFRAALRRERRRGTIGHY
jgi:ABC-2 type transport system permease protein